MTGAGTNGYSIWTNSQLGQMALVTIPSGRHDPLGIFQLPVPSGAWLLGLGGSAYP